MATNEERREVAGYIRQIDCSGFTAHSMDDGDGRSLLCAYIAEAVGVGHAPYYFDAKPLCDRLADLIEPDERTCRIELSDFADSTGQKMHRCSACGALTIDDACFFDNVDRIEWFNFCPNCGAKVVEP